MPVPPRQTVPSLLQVDAILGHLAGLAALEEVCRFLGAELPQYATLAVYRPEGGAWRRWTNAEALADGTATLEAGRGAVARLIADRRTAIVDGAADPGGAGLSEIAVGVTVGGRLVAVLHASRLFAAVYDATDARFLEKVAEKIRGAVQAASADGPSATA